MQNPPPPSRLNGDSTQPKQTQTPQIGSCLSLISISDIRYEGILHSVDGNQSTICLSKVRSFGTEDRAAAEKVNSSSTEYDFIIFKASDIKDLELLDRPSSAASFKDPAIVSMSPPEQDNGSSSDFASSGHSNLSNGANSNMFYDVGVSHPPPVENIHRLFNQNESHAPRTYASQAVPMPHRAPPPLIVCHPPRPQPRPHRPNPNMGNARNGVVYPQKKNTNKEKEKDFDFEQSNETFIKQLHNGKSDGEHSDNVEETAPIKSEIEKGGEPVYNKNRSFFDSISCEAIENSSQSERPIRRDRKVNSETFGQSALRRMPNNRQGQGRGGNGNMDMYGPPPGVAMPWMPPPPPPPPHFMWQQYMQAMHQHALMYPPNNNMFMPNNRRSRSHYTR